MTSSVAVLLIYSAPNDYAINMYCKKILHNDIWYQYGPVKIKRCFDHLSSNLCTRKRIFKNWIFNGMSAMRIKSDQLQTKYFLCRDSLPIWIPGSYRDNSESIHKKIMCKIEDFICSINSHFITTSYLHVT